MTTIFLGTQNGFIGGIVGYADSIDENHKILIKNCKNTNDVMNENKNAWYVGGIIGFLKWGSVENCCNSKVVTGGTATGGIAGKIDDKSSIKLCFNIGQIEGYEKVGGVLGVSSENSFALENCYNKGEVKANYNYVGGVEGFVRVPIKNCYNTGVILLTSTTNDRIGALIGAIDTSYIDKDKMENCYYLGSSAEKACGNEVSIGKVDELISKNETEMQTEVAGLLGEEYEENTEGDMFPKLKWE